MIIYAYVIKQFMKLKKLISQICPKILFIRFSHAYCIRKAKRSFKKKKWCGYDKNYVKWKIWTRATPRRFGEYRFSLKNWRARKRSYTYHFISFLTCVGHLVDWLCFWMLLTENPPKNYQNSNARHQFDSIILVDNRPKNTSTQPTFLLYSNCFTPPFSLLVFAFVSKP